MKNSGENGFDGIKVADDVPALVIEFLNAHDFAAGSRRGFVLDLRKFARWFVESNNELFVINRVTTRDVTDFRNHLRRDKQQAVATVNRNLVTIRRFFGWLVDKTIIASNPAKPVKELKRQQLAPKGLDKTAVRKLLREVELRQDVRAAAIFGMMLYCGCRCSDLVNLELDDLDIGERTGTVCFRFGKGSKERTVPLPLPARKTMAAYLESRPPVESKLVFQGERGAISDKGIRSMCDKYALIIGVKLHPHLLRHTFSHQFLADTGNDLVGLAQILGHSNLNTTARYTQRNTRELSEAAEKVNY